MDPKRLYVMMGEPSRPGAEPEYPTDPRHYGLDLFTKPITDDEFDTNYKHRVKAFAKLDDAIDFAYRCALNGTGAVFDRVQDEWVYNEEATWEAFDIDW